MADSTLSNLLAIQTKVRRLTRSPSENLLSTNDLNNYINTFVLYDFPEHIRLFNLRTTFQFICNPLQDVYDLSAVAYQGFDVNGNPVTVTGNPLYDFLDNFVTIHPPFYIAGYQSLFSQSREQFFGLYPDLTTLFNTNLSGDGITTVFQGTGGFALTSVPVQQEDVLFSSIDVNGNGLQLVDSPVLDSTTGVKTNIGVLYNPTNPPPNLPLILAAPYVLPAAYTNNFINYSTGVFALTFPTAPAQGEQITAQVVPFQQARPLSVLLYDNQLTLRPIPDQPYQVTFEAYQAPTELLAQTQTPLLQEFWQYIAYGAAKKIFEDRMDPDSVALIMPEFKQQERLVLRRTLVQQSNEKTSTIYDAQNPFSSYWGWGSNSPF